MPTSEFNDDRAALDYIRKRGYASYSSIKNVRDCVEPTAYKEEVWHTFGKEHHSRLLEKKRLTILSLDEEKKLALMMQAMERNMIAKRLLIKSVNEIDFGPRAVLDKYKSKRGIVVPSIYGVPVYGRIDILNTDSICDLKTTKLTAMAAFVAAMDFLQAAIYLAAVPRKDFYYIGQSKVEPHVVMPFAVSQYPALLDSAQMEMKSLLKYIKSKL